MSQSEICIINGIIKLLWPILCLVNAKIIQKMAWDIFLKDLTRIKRYHEPVWPQPSFLSSRGYHFELTFPGYSELRFLPISGDTQKGHVVYWHYTYRQIKTTISQSNKISKYERSFFSDQHFYLIPSRLPSVKIQIIGRKA